MDDNSNNSEEDNFEMSWLEINIIIIVFTLFVITYLIYSYGEYVECLNFEQNYTFQTKPQCEFPKRP